MAEDDAARWDRRYREGSPPGEPAAFLVEHASLLPPRGRALDVAGGGGRNALWLAERGLSVTLVDRSAEALALARRRAAARSLALQLRRLDLPDDPLPPGPWDVVLVVDYLDLATVRTAAAALAPGGLLLLCHPTVRNLRRHARPSRRWLLGEGELATVVAGIDGVEVLELDEGWRAGGRHEARLVLRRSSVGA